MQEGLMGRFVEQYVRDDEGNRSRGVDVVE